MTDIAKTTKEDIYRKFKDHVSSGKVHFFESVGIDFVFGRRKGPYVWDTHSKHRLINCHCNGGVFNLGHRHPVIADTLRAALEELDIGNHHLVSERRALLAEKLAALTPGELTYTVFGVGGGEAIDLAIKLARGYTGRINIISATGGYHGHTGLALATGDEQYRKPFGPNPPGFQQVPFNHKAVLEQTINSETAAVIFETIPATAGIPIPDRDYFQTAHDLCRKHGALFIADEVQTGLGRTGRLWGIDHFDVVPDILVIGKGLSGGFYPMTATCFGAELEVFFHDNPFIHVSTFGGAELGCPVAEKVLEISSNPDFLKNVRDMADIFKTGFQTLKARHPKILVSLRQLGLMMGIEMANEACGPVLSKTLYDHGILSVYANNNTRVSQLLPPLIIDEVIALEILERIDRALADAEAFLGL